MTDGTGPRKGLEAVRRHKAEWDRDGMSLDEYADASDRFESTETEPGLIRWTIQKNTALAWLVALLWLLGSGLELASLIDLAQNPDALTSIYLAVVNLALAFFAINLLATVLLYTEREELDRPIVTDGGRIVSYDCEECGPVPDPDLGDHGQPLCPDCGRTVEQVATDGGEESDPAGGIGLKEVYGILREEGAGPLRAAADTVPFYLTAKMLGEEKARDALVIYDE